MKAKKRILLLALLVLLVCTGVPLAQEQAGKLFEKALFLEESEGDLLKAITLYEKIIKDYGKELEISAKAQLHIGFCYEKLGKTEAIKAYELVVENYSSQKEQVTAALTRLADLKKEPPKGLSVTKLEGWEKPGMAFEPYQISPSGTFGVGLEFMKGQNIIIYDLETKEVKFITDHKWEEAGIICWTYHPILSPDSKEIIYYYSCDDKNGPAGNALIVTTLDGQTTTIASSLEDWYIPNAWLPDGSAILTIKGKQDTSPELGFYPKDGGDFKPLVTLQKEEQGIGRTFPTASISPDGKYILYTDAAPGDQNDIYIVKTNGENPKPLIKHPAADKSPRWSPDGKHLAFLSLRHGSWALWAADFKDGDLVGNPYLIRDGMKDSHLMNWTENGLASWDWVTISDVYLMDIDPATYKPIGKPTQVEYTPTGYNGGCVWSPDGKSFAFLSGIPNLGIANVVVVGNEIREYAVPKEYGFGVIKWKPDNSGLGMAAGNKEGKWFLYQLNLDPEKWEAISIPLGSWTQFDWTGDGKSILLAQAGYAEKGAGIFKYNLETGEKHYVYTPQDTGAILIRYIRCSKDYNWIAFLESNRNLLVANLETGESRVLATDIGYPSWSPDGQEIITDATFTPEKSKQSYYIIPADGGPVNEIDLKQVLPKKSEIRIPDWSPDGKRIVFTLRSSVDEISLFQNVIPSVQ